MTCYRSILEQNVGFLQYLCKELKYCYVKSSAMNKKSLKPQGSCLLLCLCEYHLSDLHMPVTTSGELQSAMENNLPNSEAKPWRGKAPGDRETVSRSPLVPALLPPAWDAGPLLCVARCEHCERSHCIGRV